MAELVLIVGGIVGIALIIAGIRMARGDAGTDGRDDRW